MKAHWSWQCLQLVNIQVWQAMKGSSLNIQAVVAMHDPVPESEWPPETIVEGKEPFPILCTPEEDN
jgi:hypothetical protein